MKKNLLTALLSFLSVAAFAQSSGKTTISFEGGVPISPTSDFSSFIVGGSIKYDLPVIENVFVTFSGGYSSVLLKNGATNTSGGGSVGLVPIKIGGKYFFTSTLFGEAQLGAAFSTEKGGKTSLAQAIGLGVKVSERVEFGSRYEGWSQNGGIIQQLGFRLGVSF
ncbi:hypothetical protein DJ568_02225 [Mucilaginibacter hurinus]|uniref:Uncharacterized protein n=1 Tax=Mucilaginibacter hurinus TaxID=2201324 RepID=A0A367GTE9_9SPHI|nr:hypothetical protein [Mucilaginibacter hurinus]RCH56694.1 hypothetical protein DJ568_02225 [Mucilaginibacter hurinus]